MTEPVEKTYYVPVYEKCKPCGGRGYYNWTVPTTHDGSCPHCHGEGYVKVYISLAEWATQTREHVGAVETKGALSHEDSDDNNMEG